MPKPLTVVFADVHERLDTLGLVDPALRAGIRKAAELQVPVVIAGDLNDTKSMLRAECVQSLIRIMEYAMELGVRVYVLIGNHDLLHEKGSEHSLHFLSAHCTVVSSPTSVDGFNFIPYQSKAESFYDAIKIFPKGSIVFAHQGMIGGQLGHYFKDDSSVDPEIIKDWRVFVGHFHSHYDLVNTVSIGNPYSLSYGEAKDGPKGFLVVYDDGSFERVILPLRKHVVIETDIESWKNIQTSALPDARDYFWLKLHGPYTELQKIKKNEIGKALLSHNNFKLDLIPTDSPVLETRDSTLSDGAILDKLIENTNENIAQKIALKALWRELLK